MNYLRTNPIAGFPYDYQNQYVAENIEVFDDHEKMLRYVLLDDKRLYFKRRWSKQKIRNLCNLLLKELDIGSPHRYLTGQFKFDDGEVLIDVGAAEGNYALSIVEKASRLILFEADKEWIEPLNATFEPWKNKVLIVNKFVSDVTNSTYMRLDDFISIEKTGIFLKSDIEGGELLLLKGCERILTDQKPLNIAICTYHKQEDEKEFLSLLAQNGFKTSHYDGFILYYYDKKMTAPYFRRGLIRAERK